MTLDDIILPDYENPYIRFQMERYGNIVSESNNPFADNGEGDGTDCIENRNQISQS